MKASQVIERVFERIEQGKGTVILASMAPEELLSRGGLTIIRVQCDDPHKTWGPLERLQFEAASLVGHALPREHVALGELVRIRRFILGDEPPEQSVSEVLIESLERLAIAADKRVAVVIDAIDRADPATIAALKELMTSRALRVPVIVSALSETETISELVTLLRGQWGEEAILTAHAADTQALSFDWSLVASEQLLLARAAATVGDVFESSLVASLLGSSELEVLHALQMLADAGAPIIDRGHGRFSFGVETTSRLREGLLPSVERFWSERLAELVSKPRKVSQTHQGHDAIEAPAPTPIEPASPITQEMMLDDEWFAETEGLDRASFAEFFASDPAATTDHGEAMSPAAIPPRPRMTPSEGLSPASSADPARAADYLESAGRVDEAIEHLLDAASQVAARGDARRALLLARRALELVEQGPPTAPMRARRARVLGAIARIQWSGAALGSPFSMHEAMDTVDRALEDLPSSADVTLRAELLTLAAGILYDVGDVPSLQRALESLNLASKLLNRYGMSIEAASLLNDQAAVLVRFGDSLRAVHLLEQSKQIFEAVFGQGDAEEVAAAELAETYHLLARMPVAARLKEQQREQAIEVALEHAVKSAHLYSALGDERSLARVWETMGRLEMSWGRQEKAEQQLARALMIQRGLGDVVGLARTAAALSDVFVSRGDFEPALTLLAESVAINAEKGATRGLVFNQRALDALALALMTRDDVPEPTLQRLRELRDFLNEVL